jgi:hypothetical protein
MARDDLGTFGVGLFDQFTEAVFSIVDLPHSHGVPPFWVLL